MVTTLRPLVPRWRLEPGPTPPGADSGERAAASALAELAGEDPVEVPCCVGPAALPVLEPLL